MPLKYKYHTNEYENDIFEKIGDGMILSKKGPSLEKKRTTELKHPFCFIKFILPIINDFVNNYKELNEKTVFKVSKKRSKSI